VRVVSIVARMSETISGNERDTDPDLASLIRATNLVGALFGADVASRVGRVRGFDDSNQELRNTWRRTAQPGLDRD
jgi:hypothetical protein